MPVTLEVDHELHKATTVATGPITMADIRSHLEDETQRGGLGYRELIDGSKASVGFTTTDVRATVDILRKLGREGALGPAAVIVPDEVSYGMLRLLEILLEDVVAVRPFRERERHDAEEWLATAPILGKAGGC